MTIAMEEGGPRGDAEEKAALLMRLRAVGVRTTAILRAMELVGREGFVPPELAPFAAQDIALPIDCGQTMLEPSFVARQLEALAPAPDSRVLEVGSGTGYVTALLCQLAGTVLGYERYRRLAEAAAQRLATWGVTNAAVVWGDGLGVPGEAGLFDRILLHASVPAPPAGLLERLAPEGIMVCALHGPDGRQGLVRLHREAEGSLTALRVCEGRLQPAREGRSLVL